MIIPNKNGIVKIEHKNNVIIVTSDNDNLFKGNIHVTLIEEAIISLPSKLIILAKGDKGRYFNGKVFFHIGLKYFGIGVDVLQEKTMNILPLC